MKPEVFPTQVGTLRHGFLTVEEVELWLAAGCRENQTAKSVPNLWNKVLLPGVGHWTEQEAPTEVNRLMADFLISVDGTDAANSRLHLETYCG